MNDEAHPRTDAAALAPTETLARLARANVLVVGDAMLDRYIHGRAERLSPEAPVPVLAIEREVALPGGAANVVRNLTALGAAAAFVSVVGDDQTGSDLTGLIGGQPGVEPWLLVQGGRTTTRKTRFLAEGRHLLRADREQTDPIEPRLAERLLRIAQDAMAVTSLTVLSDYGKGVLSGGLSRQLIQKAHELGRKIVVDPSNGDCARFAGADLILPTAGELAQATGMAVGDDDEIAAAAASLMARHRFGAVMALRGTAGISLFGPGDPLHVRLPHGVPLDLFGVTDAVLAILAAALAVGLALPAAGQLAGASARLVATRIGAVVPTPADLLATLAEDASAP
jgi:D-beta-D-heptose 7-phosphate kinase/D-beta-D-heptose 1-phosphate adenosyltransferase